jgi:hypothetical protein
VRTASLRTHGLEGEVFGGLHFDVGDVLSGRYEITRFIARGGMGEVYAAHDRMLGDEIALKVLLRPTLAGAGVLDRLRAEVQLARRVADPHVLRVFDLGSYETSDGGELLFLTMQLLQGETLRARIRRAGPIPFAETARLAGDMFAALAAAHRIGIVHRDFKSDNVMLVPTEEGPPRAVVMDFGLASSASDAPRTNDGTPLVAGTLGYMAPEQLAGSPVTAAVDVYAFGVVLHEMLTGVLPPFRPVVPRRGEAAPPPPPPALLDGLNIPSQWSALIRRCLERDPALRFADILAAREAVTSRSHRSNRRVVFAAAGVAALAAATSGVLWKRGAPETPAPVAAMVAAPATPPVAPPAARESTEPARPIPAAEPVPEASKIEQPARSRPRRPRAPAPAEATPETRTPPETSAPIRAAAGRSIADTDDAIDPFREPR